MTVSLQLLLSLPYCPHLVSLHPPAGNAAEVPGSFSHQLPLVREEGRSCACDCGEEGRRGGGEEEIKRVGGGREKEDEEGRR